MKKEKILIIFLIIITLTSCGKNKKPESDIINGENPTSQITMNHGVYKKEELPIPEMDFNSLEASMTANKYFYHEGKLKTLSIEMDEDEKGKTYSFFTLEGDQWLKDTVGWHVSGDNEITDFNFTDDGLYASKITFSEEEDEREDGKIKNSICKLLDNGEWEEVSLHDIDKAMEVTVDSANVKQENTTGLTVYIKWFKIFDGNMAILAYSNNMVKVYDLHTGESLYSLPIYAESCWSVVKGEDLIVYSQGSNPELNVVSLNTGEVTRTIGFGESKNKDSFLLLCDGSDDDVYLYSGVNGVYGGKYTDKSLTCILDKTDMELPDTIEYLDFFSQVGEGEFFIAGSGADGLTEEEVKWGLGDTKYQHFIYRYVYDEQ